MAPLGYEMNEIHSNKFSLRSSLSSRRLNNSSRNHDANTNTKTSQQHQQRSVVFDPHVCINETLHRNDFTDEEYLTYWLTHEDYEMIHEMIDITLQLLELGQEEDDENFVCFRGVKERTSDALLRYEQKRLTIMDCILSEQTYQKSSLGFVDRDILARLCAAQTKSCAQKALTRAQADQYAIQDYTSSSSSLASSSSSSNSINNGNDIQIGGEEVEEEFFDYFGTTINTKLEPLPPPPLRTAKTSYQEETQVSI